MSHIPFTTRQIGDLSITAVSDGYINGSLDFLSGITKNKAEEIQYSAKVIIPERININCYLLRSHGQTILVDTGAGGINNVGGELITNLRSLGITPEEIDYILLTHCHPDHIGGLVDSSGNKNFPKTKIFIHPHEVEYWQDNEKLNQASERVKGHFALVRQVLSVYRQSLQFLDNNKNEVLPRIHFVPLAGHTPGHTGYRINVGEEQVLIWGDIMHFPYIQTEYPEVSIAFDYDPVLAIETRKKILEQSVREKYLIAGMHLEYAAFAYILPTTTGYKIKYSTNDHF